MASFKEEARKMQQMAKKEEENAQAYDEFVQSSEYHSSLRSTEAPDVPVSFYDDPQEKEQVTDVQWLDRELFCTGYTSGILRIFNRVGKLVFEQKLHGVAVQKLDVNNMEGELSVLYADSTVAIIQISEILGKLNSPVFGPAQASKFRKYSLRDQKDIVAVVPCGPRSFTSAGEEPISVGSSAVCESAR
eukprot:jgi/Phyca11/19127/fgenesh1_pg.PHYCAscaffold_44_\